MMQAGKEDKKSGAEEVITKCQVCVVARIETWHQNVDFKFSIHSEKLRAREKVYCLLTGLSILATYLPTCLSLSDHKNTWLLL